MGWEVGAEQLSDPGFMRNLEAEYLAHLQDVIQEADVELRTAPPESPQSRYLRQKRAAFSTALAEAKADGLKFNGVVFTATTSGFEKIRTGASVLAIEILSGSQRAFAIPLEIYQ